MQVPRFAELFAALDMVVMERRSAGSFRLSGPVPDWFRCFYPEAAPGYDGLRLGDMFLFLENFLIDAEQFWLTRSAGQLKSGPWGEIDALGHEHYLEASAVCLGEQQFLLLALPTIEYAEKQAIIQKARENNLASARFHKELQQKEVLFHCIVHDLAGPLTPIMLALSLLESEPLTTVGQQAVETCMLQASRQRDMIQQILDVFAAEVRLLAAPVRDPVAAPNVVWCAQTMIEALRPSCLPKHITLQLAPDVDPMADWRVVGEPSRLERILFNLVENALRYSPRNSAVTIGVTAQEAGVLVTVDDEGPGVPPEMVRSIFEKFSRDLANPGKAGLGLYFCRLTIEGWGGTIGYTPLTTGGARFWFRLPRPAAGEALSVPVAQSAAAGQRAALDAR
jgi:signal transduction histidine kinase